jgi:transposase
VPASMWQVREELWEVVEPLVPVHERDPRGGRRRVDDRVCFGAIPFVLFTGIARRHLPRELGYSPATGSSSVSRPYWSGSQPQPHRITGSRGASPNSSRASSFSGST